MVPQVAEHRPDIEADERKVKVILYNLLSNAVKFTPEGGQIGMRAKRIDSEIEIVVWDMGSASHLKTWRRCLRVLPCRHSLLTGDRGDRTRFAALEEVRRAARRDAHRGIGGYSTRALAVRFTLPIASGKVA